MYVQEIKNLLTGSRHEGLLTLADLPFYCEWTPTGSGELLGKLALRRASFNDRVSSPEKRLWTDTKETRQKVRSITEVPCCFTHAIAKPNVSSI